MSKLEIRQCPKCHDVKQVDEFTNVITNTIFVEDLEYKDGKVASRKFKLMDSTCDLCNDCILLIK